MMKKLVGFCVVGILAAACGGVSGGGDDDGMGAPDAGIDNPDEPDTTAPEILAITPANGAAGVRADATVVIEFSEPMDQLSVQNSLDTSDLGGVTFAWSDGGATLTITPDDALDYAEGEGNFPENIDPVSYHVVLGTGATDEAGNPVDVGVETLFTTLKSMTTTFARDNALTGAGTPSGVTTDADDFIYIGDDDLGGAANGYRGYITMDMSPLPDTTVAIVEATLAGYQLGESGDPYGELGDGTGIIMEHGVFTLGDSNADNAAFNMEPLSEVGVFADTGDTELGIDVTSQVADDLANRDDRSDRSQYRLRFETFTNLDATADYVVIGRDQLALDVVYLVP
jgi:hypothetical protein